MSWNAVTDHAQDFLNAAAHDPSSVLLALDFDGTLAPIVDDPEDSRMHDGAAEALALLGERLGHVAIITGRGVAVVRRLGRLEEREGFGRVVVLGQYCAEHQLILEPGRNVLELRASALTKGDSLRALVAETGATVVAMGGDDLGDLPAFEALREMRAAGLTTCAVVSGSAEQPMMAEQADVLAEGPDGVAAWLRDLAAALDR